MRPDPLSSPHVRPPRRLATPPESAAAPLPRAPWLEEIGAEAARELDLVPLAARAGEWIGAADVAVIGAGVAGLSAALAAADRGARVVVLEAQARLGTGATGQNAGILSAGINMGLADVPPGSAEAAMWPATTAMLLALVEQARAPGALLQASRTGSLSLAESATAARHLAREARARVAAGLRAEIWSSRQVADATAGRLRMDGVRCALWLPDEGRVNPLTLLAHLARQARAAGADLIGCARVVACAVEREGGQTRWRVTVAGEAPAELRARALVRAVGPVVEPTARIAALAFQLDLPESFPLFWDARPYTYCDFRPARGRLVASGGRYSRPGAAARDALYQRRLAEQARHWLPELAGAQPTHAWAVDLAVAANLSPRLRALDAQAPGLAIEGLGALGVLPGMVLGRRAGERLAAQVARP